MHLFTRIWGKSTLLSKLTLLMLFVLVGTNVLQAQNCPGNVLSGRNGYYGGFEAGGTNGSNNFGSNAGLTDHTYGLPSNGTYEIVNDVNEISGGGGYLNIKPKSGNYFMLAHTRANRIWYKTVAVTPGATYQFCAWVVNAKQEPSTYSVELRIKAGSQTTVVASTNVSYNWKQLCGTYTVPAGVTSIELQIFDPTANTNVTSHFLGLDDICFTAGSSLTLGNNVWADLNNNGTKDAGEPGISGATVKLYSSSGTYLNKSATTDASGNYSFTGLTSDNYIVGVTLPQGYTKGDVGVTSIATDNQNDGVNMTGNEVRTSSFTLNQSSNNIDFGLKTISTTVTACPNNTLSNSNGYYGGFEAGGTNGSNNFGPNAGMTNYTYGLPPNGNYEIVKNASDASGGGYRNVSAKSGQYFMLSHTNSGSPVWYKTVAVTPGFTYQFCAYIVNAKDAPSTYSIQLRVKTSSGTTTIASQNVTYTWNQICGTYTVPAGVTSIEIQVVDPNHESNGASHFLGLDDICFASLTQTYTLGGTVWNDANNDGLLQSGEAVIPGATVRLYDQSGNYLNKQTTTDANGNYSFPGLTSGNYIVGVTLPSGYQKGDNGQTNINADNQNDGVVLSGNEVRTTSFSLTQSSTNIDFGIKRIVTGSIGDRVWNDLNGNGIQDAGEPGLSGILVSLYDEDDKLVGSTQTNSSGNYTFNNLPISATGTTYTLEFSLPVGFVFSPKDAGSNDAIDSDVNASGVTTVTLTTSSPTTTTVDAGVLAATNGRIGDRIWYDVNGNGVQDAGEPGLSNVVVTLYAANGTSVLSTTVTDANGNYGFNNLPAGTYVVGITPPSGFSISPTGAGTPSTDNDFNPSTAKTGQITLAVNEVNNNVDGGLFLTPSNKASIGDRVWNDLNKNGIQDAGEPGLANVTVQLYNSSNVLVATTVTNALGIYTFSDVPHGTYYVKFIAPSGFAFSPADQGSNDAVDSDVNGANGTGTTATFNLTASTTTIDAGLYQMTTTNNVIGDFLWYDINKNGLQDAGEPGAGCIEIQLVNATTGAVVATTHTDMNGYYLFTNVAPGTYYLMVPNLPIGYIFTTKDVGTNDAVDSDFDPATNRTINFIVTGSNQVTLIWDGGLIPAQSSNTGVIGDRVWNDLNGNGIQDMNEPGVAGVTVTLYAGNGTTVIGTTTTNQFGNYQFTNVPSGYYILGFTNLPDGYNFTIMDAGSNEAIDSDVNPSEGRTNIFFLLEGQVNNSMDAGIHKPNSSFVGGDVWNDLDGDGLLDAGEPRVGGITVHLYDANMNLLATTVTDNNGVYGFSNLPAGTYIIGFDNLPPGYTATTRNPNGSDVDPVTLRTDPFTLADSQVLTDKDFGIKSTKGVIGDFVWNDLNGNGLQDAGEPGLPGIVVILYNSSGVAVGSAVTDANGFYSFSNVEPGTYTLGFSNLPAGAQFTTKGSGTANDSDVNPSTGRTDPFVISAGQVNNNVDAGIRLATNNNSIGNLVWNDLNNNGVLDAGEPGIPGALVILYDASGAPISATVTNNSGIYNFSGLAPGTYTVGVTLPSGFAAGDNGTTNVNADNQNDGVITVGTEVRTSQFTISSSTNNIDFGLKAEAKGSIGDRVWNDLNRNGIQDAGEPGLAGVVVSLYNSNNVLIASTITDALGNYSFNNLQTSTVGTFYSVRFSLPAGFVFSPRFATANTAIDSDADVTTGIATVNLTPTSANNTSIDAGMYLAPGVTIGDRIWYDINGNGVQDAGEPGMAGVVVTLYAHDGTTVLGTTITDANGNFSFRDLTAGTYVLGLTAPSGFAISPTGAGTPSTDNDFMPSTSKTAPFTLVANQVNNDIDGGLFAITENRGSIGDRVWNDLNGNGIQDAGEPGIAGVTIQLYSATNVLVATTVTNAFGNYYFSNLTVGTNYYVRFNAPSGYSFSPSKVGANDHIDSDVTGTFGAGTTALVAAAAGKNSVDAGMILTSTTGTVIGDFIWYDLNRNGLQDAGEPGVAGVTLQLVNANTYAVVQTTVTDAQGFYLFTNVPMGSYFLAATTLPAGYTFTTKNAGSNIAVDSDFDATTNRTTTFLVNTNGAVLTQYDGGLVQNPGTFTGRGVIGDRVWLDLNGNGIQDLNEPGVGGVTVTLYASNSNTVVATTTSDALGNYTFNNLPAGYYSVGFNNLPAGYSFTSMNSGTNSAVDSDVNPPTGRTNIFYLLSGQVNNTIDAGLFRANASLVGGDVWNDINGNGLLDAGEPPVAGITVYLYDQNLNLIATTVTDFNGVYGFVNVPAGNYIIGFGNLPPGYTATTRNPNGSNVDPVTLRTDVFAFDGSSVVTDKDFGIRTITKGVIGDFVWNDINRNGIQDAGEPGLGGIVVTLYNSTGVAISSTVTNGNGYYTFNNVEPGTYTLGFGNLPAGTQFTVKGGGTSNDSDVNPSTGRTDQFVLNAGIILNTMDAGIIVSYSSVGDYVWHDTSGDGVQQAHEPGVGGVLVTLYNAAGTPVSATVTNGNGFYSFNNVAPGNYSLGFSNLPAGTSFTVQNAGGDPTKDSDVNPSTGRTNLFSLIAGIINYTVDAGLAIPSGGPLPAHKIDLTAVLSGNMVALNWNVLNEGNTSEYIIERSTNGLNFTAEGRKAARGIPSGVLLYNADDNISSLMQEKIIYYRIKAFDTEGRFRYSAIVPVKLKQLDAITVWPNPFTNNIQISFKSTERQRIQVQLFDVQGQMVRNESKVVEAGNVFMSIDNASTLPKGAYMLKLQSDSNVIMSKLLIKD